MVFTNEIVFLMVGLITLGMTVHAWSLYGGLPDTRPTWFLMAAFVLADIACLSTAAVALVSPVFLTVTNAGLFATQTAVALTMRSWRLALTRQVLVWSGGLMLLVLAGFEFMRLNGTYVQRVIAYTLICAVLMGWMLYEVFQRQKDENSSLLKFLMGVVMASLALRVARLVFVLQQTTQPETMLQEPAVSAILRNTAVSMDVLILSSLLAYSTHVLAMRYEKTAKDNQQVRDAHQALEAVLEEKNQMLKALTTSTKSRNMGVLLASLAHELNQPLAAMQLKLEYLKSQPQLATAERQSFLDELLQDNARAGSIIVQLRKFLRHGSTDLQRVSLERVLDDAMDVMKPQLEKLQVHVQYEAASGVWVQAVEGQLQMVLLNLFKNAVDALKEIPAPRRFLAKLVASEREVTLTVADNGLGIEPSQWERVFDMFYSTKVDGMGLGLWLSRSILQSQGGSMSVSRSTLGGACFTLTWPRVA